MKKTTTATATVNRNSKGFTDSRVKAINEKYGMKLFLTYEEEQAIKQENRKKDLAYLEKANAHKKPETITKHIDFQYVEQENNIVSLNTYNHSVNVSDTTKNRQGVIENKTGYIPEIVTEINRTIKRIYEKPDTIPFSACKNLMEWVAVNNIHVAIAHSAVNWQANRDGSKYACRHKNDQYTQVVAQKILNGENLVYSMDDCAMDCFAGLQKYANEKGEKACFTLENNVVSLEHDFITNGFRAVSNGMKNNASVQGVHETAIEVKGDDGKWIEIALSPVQLGKVTQWECDIMVADIVRNICDSLPTEDHKKWLLCRMSGYKKTEIQKELGVSRQKCRELEKVVVSIGKKIVDYSDLFEYAIRKEEKSKKPSGVYVRDLMKTNF